MGGCRQESEGHLGEKYGEEGTVKDEPRRMSQAEGRLSS